MDLLRAFLDDSGQADMVSALELEGAVSVRVFKRAQVGLEVFHSVEYHLTTSRCSYHVCCQLEEDDASTKRFGRVLRHYKMQEGMATFRFCEMECFKLITTETDKVLGHDTDSTASPDTKRKFVALEDFRRNVMLFEPKDCTDRNEARVLQCSTKRVEPFFISSNRTLVLDLLLIIARFIYLFSTWGCTAPQYMYYS